MSVTPMRTGADPEHYSYRVYADPAMANAFDTMRFSGPIGTLLAEDQARVLLSCVGAPEGRTILDVGTGTGRAALILAAAGARVTGIDASDEMLRVARARAADAGLSITFAVGDAHALQVPDRAFDTVVSFRVLMHTPGWRTCLAELCRVSNHRVVFDYPSACSVAAIQAVGRRVAARLGSGTEAYRVFRHASLQRVLETQGFRVVRRHRQFVLPIAFHKWVGSRRVTERLEGTLASLGLLRVFGSPVTVIAERCAR